MSDLISRTARLVPYTKRPKNSASFVTAYAYEPAADEAGAHLGNLFVVTEVLTSGRASEEVVDLIIESVGEKYYNDPAGPDDALTRFEAAIKQTNHELSEYVGRGNAAWIGKLSAIIAIQAGSELQVSHTGSAEAFLYRGKAVSRITQSETSKPATPSKTFGSIATGELEIGDKFLLATPALIHQVPLNKLQTVIASSSPNAAISELSLLLENAQTIRIAAVIVEITTPELAAVKVRSDEPDEIELGNGSSLAETALSVAAPLAQTTAISSKRAVRAAATTIALLKPYIHKISLAGAERVRNALSTKSGRRTVLVIFTFAVMLTTALIWHSSNQAATASRFNDYQNLYRQYQTSLGPSLNKATAKSSLENIKKSLAGFEKYEASIDSQLKNQPLLSDEPASLKAFGSLVSTAIDKLDGLIFITPMTLAEIGGHSGHPTHMETDGIHAYIFDSANKNSLVIVNLDTGDQKDSGIDGSKFGDVLNTTISDNNEGIYILTSKPSVWFYRFSNDTVTEQTLAYGTWPKAHSIASYGPNLYLLGDGIVYKHTKNATGYSPKSDYISTTLSSTHPTSMAVDGYVYIASDAGLQRFLGPILQKTSPYPAGLSNVINLRSVNGGNAILGLNQKTGHIILWDASNNKLNLSKQISVSSNGTITDAIYDPKAGKMFAIIDNRLVSFNINP